VRGPATGARGDGREVSMTVRIDGPRGGELGFPFVNKTLMRNLNRVNLHNSRSPNSPSAS
jgi:hypothetical protein